MRELLRLLGRDARFELALVLTGSHLSAELGSTWREVQADGIEIRSKVDMLLSSDNPVAIAKSLGLGVIGFAHAFETIAPDMVVLPCDRFEILAAAQAALIARLPIAHLYGGEVTEGAFDDAFRHAITKMAQLHFVAAEPYRQRVIQLGEQPETVFNVGAPGLDGLDKVNWPPREDLVKEYDLSPGAQVFLVTYHPSTLGDVTPEVALAELLTALDRFPEANVVFTAPNADPSGRSILNRIAAYARGREPRVKLHLSLGRTKYLSLMRISDIVIGNSSSGITEAPALRRASVNVGQRQTGRLKAKSVIDCRESADEIELAIRHALSPGFREALPRTASHYGQGGASALIVDILARWLPVASKGKHFYDLVPIGPEPL